MNKLPLAKRVQILAMLCEGSSMRSISRVTDVSMRRFTRLTNAFSKKFDNHVHALSLYFVFYNFCRIHKTLRMSPAMAAGVTDRLWSLEGVLARIGADTPAPVKRGPYKPRNSK